MISTMTGLQPRGGSWLLTGAAAAVYAAAFLWIADYTLTAFKDAAPVADWFEVERLQVMDARGPLADPEIEFARTIHRDTPGTFTATVYKIVDADDETGTFWCGGQGGAAYKAGRSLPADANHLAWIMNRHETPCHFVPGAYRLVIDWTFTPEGHPAKHLRAESNAFRIR